jgi:hypothetical protein
MADQHEDDDDDDALLSPCLVLSNNNNHETILFVSKLFHRFACLLINPKQVAARAMNDEEWARTKQWSERAMLAGHALLLYTTINRKGGSRSLYGYFIARAALALD